MKLKYKKILGVMFMVLIAFVFFLNTSTINAAINKGYGSGYEPDNTNLGNTIENSTLLDLLGHLVFAVGRIMEWTLGTIFTAITGSADFPWADKIVFNAVAILDVNFINPDANSFLGVSSISKAITNIYATVFSIAFTFFGSFAIISAIKLAVSTIADQKAKYKQALVDWIMGFLLLFTMHYFMSFIFYLNEELVETASKIAEEAVQEAGVKFQLAAGVNASDLIERVKDWDATKGAFLEANSGIVEAWINMEASDNSDGLMEAVTKNEDPWWDKAIDDTSQYENLYRVVKWVKEKCPEPSVMEDLLEGGTVGKGRIFWVEEETLAGQDISTMDKKYYIKMNFQYLRRPSKDGSSYPGTTEDSPNTEYTITGTDTFNTQGYMFQKNDTNQMWDGNESGGQNDCHYPKSNGDQGSYVDADTDKGAKFLTDCGIPKGGNISVVYAADNWNFTRVVQDVLALKKAAINTGVSDTKKASNSVGAVIATLGDYFKSTSYEADFRDTNVTGVKDDKSVNIVNAIMYAILVAQSLILFISYIKRLFYVIILGLMAPVVVAYDFFKRFGR